MYKVPSETPLKRLTHRMRPDSLILNTGVVPSSSPERTKRRYERHLLVDTGVGLADAMARDQFEALGDERRRASYADPRRMGPLSHPECGEFGQVIQRPKHRRIRSSHMECTTLPNIRDVIGAFVRLLVSGSQEIDPNRLIVVHSRGVAMILKETCDHKPEPSNALINCLTVLVTFACADGQDVYSHRTSASGRS